MFFRDVNWTAKPTGVHFAKCPLHPLVVQTLDSNFLAHAHVFDREQQRTMLPLQCGRTGRLSLFTVSLLANLDHILDSEEVDPSE